MDCSGYEMLTCMFLCPCPPWIYINGHYARLLRNLENAHASLFYITFLTIPFFVSRKPTHHVTRAGFIHIGKRLDKNSLCSSAYFLGRPCTAKGTEFMQLTSSWPKTKSQLLTFSVTGFRFKKTPQKIFYMGQNKGGSLFLLRHGVHDSGYDKSACKVGSHSLVKNGHFVKRARPGNSSTRTRRHTKWKQ